MENEKPETPEPEPEKRTIEIDLGDDVLARNGISLTHLFSEKYHKDEFAKAEAILHTLDSQIENYGNTISQANDFITKHTSADHVQTPGFEKANQFLQGFDNLLIATGVLEDPEALAWLTKAFKYVPDQLAGHVQNELYIRQGESIGTATGKTKRQLQEERRDLYHAVQTFAKARKFKLGVTPRTGPLSSDSTNVKAVQERFYNYQFTLRYPSLEMVELPVKTHWATVANELGFPLHLVDRKVLFLDFIEWLAHSYGLDFEDFDTEPDPAGPYETSNSDDVAIYVMKVG